MCRKMKRAPDYVLVNLCADFAHYIRGPQAHIVPGAPRWVPAVVEDVRKRAEIFVEGESLEVLWDYALEVVDHGAGHQALHAFAEQHAWGHDSPVQWSRSHPTREKLARVAGKLYDGRYGVGQEGRGRAGIRAELDDLLLTFMATLSAFAAQVGRATAEAA